jgi:hypothetical protein
MATKMRITDRVRVKAAKTVKQIEAALQRKADADARLEMLQDRQRQAQSLRQLGYSGNDETVLARRWLDLAFTASPSLGKWAAGKVINGKKPSPVELKAIVFNWISQPVNGATRAAVYQIMALEGGA